MSYIPGKPLPGTLLGHNDEHRPAWGYICGNRIYDTNALKERMFIDPYIEAFPIIPVMWQGLCLGIDQTTKLPKYGVFPECRPQPIEFPDVNFVLKDVWLDYAHVGVTDVLRFSFISLAGYPGAIHCFNQDPPSGCASVYLTFDGSRSYTGTFHLLGGADLDITLTLTDTQDPGRPLIDGWPTVRKWEVTFSGCKSPSFTTQAHASEYWPLTLGGQGLTLSTDCCPDGGLPPDFGFRIEGFTNRFMPALLVHHKKWMSMRCCEPDPDCEVTVCCGCDVAPFQWQFSIGGVVNGPGPPFAGTACNCHNGAWILTLSDTSSRPDCTWSSELTACLPSVVMWRLRCDNVEGDYLLTSQYTFGGGGTATYSRPIADWDCLGPNVMTLVTGVNIPPAICTGWPGSVTLSPV